jgi:hypothetical protein
MVQGKLQHMSNWLNWEPIFEYLTQVKLTEWNRDAVAVSVDKATSYWILGKGRGLNGAGDERKYIVEEVELYGEEPFRHKIDILLRDRETGRLKVVDWKTRLQGKLDENWERRETRSPQKKLYVAALADRFGMDIFPIEYEVRGIVLSEDKPQVRTLGPFYITPEEATAAVHYIRDIAAMRDTLRTRGHERWPLNQQGCQIFGPAYKCEAEPFCWEGKRLFDVTEEMSERLERAMSHSKAQEFLRCPERYRLIQIGAINTNDIDEEENPSSGPGIVFHVAMEMVSNQLRSYQLTATNK